jgi:phosphatidylserine decarboxylase
MEKALPIMRRGPLGIAKEGFPFIGIGFLLMALGIWFFRPLAVVFLLFTLFCLYFFRDPERESEAEGNLLLSPADGTVLKIETLPASEVYSEEHCRISIFMSPLNVHVNRIPCDGVVREVRYHAGKFFVASLDKASTLNERNTVILETPRRQKVAFTQIAGLVARRIVCYLQPMDSVARGDRYGLIRFGSRMEVSFPLSWKILVQPGQRVKGALSALARMETKMEAGHETT